MYTSAEIVGNLGAFNLFMNTMNSFILFSLFPPTIWVHHKLQVLLFYVVFNAGCTRLNTIFLSFFLYRIERLWRDVFVGVTSIYHNILHTLEVNHLLDISNSCHLFSCHYVFLPRIQASLDVFSEGWDNHPIRTEHNLTPIQLWQVGQFQNPIMDPEVNLAST